MFAIPTYIIYDNFIAERSVMSAKASRANKVAVIVHFAAIKVTALTTNIIK